MESEDHRGARKRVYCMAITATDSRDREEGRLFWSAAVDALAAGVGDERKRFFMLSAGSAEPSYRSNYPNSNFTDGIHDPAQAWNALTVGGYTDKALVDARRYPNWAPLAPRGDLSPSSCTSITWGKWPLKPDIVLEAGNMATNSEFDEPDYINDQFVASYHPPPIFGRPTPYDFW